jgi:ribosomal protein L28
MSIDHSDLTPKTSSWTNNGAAKGDARTRSHSKSLRETKRRYLVNFARSALECAVFASPSL